MLITNRQDSTELLKFRCNINLLRRDLLQETSGRHCYIISAQLYWSCMWIACVRTNKNYASAKSVIYAEFNGGETQHRWPFWRMHISVSIWFPWLAWKFPIFSIGLTDCLFNIFMDDSWKQCTVDSTFVVMFLTLCVIFIYALYMLNNILITCGLSSSCCPTSLECRFSLVVWHWNLESSYLLCALVHS